MHRRDQVVLWYGGWLLVYIVGLIGYVANIVQLVQGWTGEWLGMEIAKLAGIFVAPLGAVMGLLGFFQ